MCTRVAVVIVAVVAFLCAAPAAAQSDCISVALRISRASEDSDFVQALRIWGMARVYGWQGTPVDPQDGAECLHDAAVLGDAAAAAVGRLYFLGSGVPQDYERAFTFLRQAAEQGEREGQAWLAAMYISGKGIPQDYVAAYLWLNLAAAQGSREAGEMRDRLARQRMTPAQVAEAQRLAREWTPCQSDESCYGKPN